MPSRPSLHSSSNPGRTSPVLVGTRLGAFVVTGEIAHGGMGVVYEGVDEGSGARVAIKTVLTTSAVMLSSIRREIETLSRLRHPGVVAIVDHGVEKGVPWYAMERLEGRTLKDHLVGDTDTTPVMGEPSATRLDESTATLVDATIDTGRPISGDEPSPPAPPIPTDDSGEMHPQVRRRLHIARRLCAPLGFLHGEGIVHRDLKPANVFLRDDEWPVLVDFGMVQSFGGAHSRERLADAEGPRGGSVAYIAPEQIAGELVDPRSDLYSLGAILYQIVTGRPPFVGSAREVITLHLTAEPAPPSRLAPWLPAALDELICRLLAKRPHARVGHAADVARLLAEIAPPPADDAMPPQPRARPYLYRPELVGRDPALHVLADLVSRRADDQPAAVLLEGPRGAGKTRLAAELAALARQRGVRVIKSECLPHPIAGADGPLSAFRPALQTVADHCREHGEAEVERLLGARAGLLAAYEPSLASLPGDSAQAAPLDSAEAERQRLYAWFAGALREFSRLRPILLLLDDVQWADELSQGLLAALGQGRVDFGDTLVVCTGHARVPALAEFRNAPRVHPLGLGPLAAGDVASLVSDMLALSEPPPRLVDELTRASEGNPFYVGEFLHAAVATGALRRDRAGRWVVGRDHGELDLPRSLGDLIARRMETFGPIERELFEIAAVFGAEIASDLWLAVGTHSEEEVLLATSRLLARNVLVEASPGHYRLAHGSLQEAIYERLPAVRRRSLHRRVAETLRARTPVDARALARHYDAADDAASAYPWLVRAGVEAQRMAAPADARALFERAFALASRPEVTADLPELHRSEITAAYAAALHGTGAIDRAGAVTRRALAELGVSIPRSRRAWIANSLWELGKQAVGLSRRVAWATAPDDHDRLRLRLLAELGVLYSAQATRLPQIGTSLIAVNLAERGHRTAALARPYSQVASLAGVLGFEGVSRRYLERALTAARSTGGRDLQHVYLSETLVALCRGHWQAVLEAVQRGLEAAHRVGDYQTIGVLHLLHSGAATVRGDPSTGLPAVHQGLRVTRRHGYVLEEGMLLLNGASFELMRRRVDAARAFLDQAAPHAAVTRDPISAALLAANRALASLLADAPREARAHADAAMSEIRRGQQSPGFVTALLRLPGVYLALCERGRGDREQALRAAGGAIDKLAGAARLQPGARPTLLLFRAHRALLLGRPRRARWLLERALDEARARDTPYAEACILDLRARLAPAPTQRDARDDRTRARALLAHVGATWPPFYCFDEQDQDP